MPEKSFLPFNKAIAIFLSVSLILSSAPPPLGAGLVPALEGRPLQLNIPAGIGKIEEVTAGSPQKIIFHIQDAHGNEDAQKNIHAILEHLTSHYHSKVILLEGGNGKLHPDLLDFFPKNPELNLKIADSLIKKAELTGAEKFLMSQKDMISYGIENIPEYRENRQSFQKVLRAKEKTGAFLNELDDQIQRLANPHLNPRLKSFLKKSEDHETSRIDFLNWLTFLKEQAKKHLATDLDDPFISASGPC